MTSTQEMLINLMLFNLANKLSGMVLKLVICAVCVELLARKLFAKLMGNTVL
jgi:hypothetical protein